MRFNSDFNVCSTCYVEQFQRRYPGIAVPIKINYLEKKQALEDEFKEDIELEYARAVIARHEEK